MGSDYYSSSYIYAKRHYKFDGSSWVKVSTLPYDFYNGSAVVLNGEIHILGGHNSSTNNNYKYHYKYNGTSWVSVSTLPYEFAYGSAVVYNDEIHIMSGSSNHYAFNGASWRKLYDIPSHANGSAVIYNDEIHLLCGSHYIVKNDNRHIATMLPKGTHIMLSDNEDINYVKNASKISSNIAEVTENGYVEVLATLPEIDDIKGYLTFY